MMNKRPRICIIGAGKAAWSVIPALLEKQYKITSVISKDIIDAGKTSRKFRIKLFSDSLKDIPGDSDIIFLLVPDDQLEKVSRRIASSHTTLNGKSVIHFSGVSTSAVLKTVSEKGAYTGSFHVMQTFPSKKRVRIAGSYASIETESRSLRNILKKIASDLELNIFEIKAADKTAYHLAGVFASNFLTANFFTAEKLFRQTGAKVSFYDFIKPIIERTEKNIYRDGASGALSGPVERGDLNTVKLHLDLLSGGDKLSALSYIAQSLNILNIKKEQGQMTPAHEKIKFLLEKNLKIWGKIHY